jgi:putative modified peptide
MASQFPPNMDRLMDKLSNDDGFRAQLMADPVNALGAIGISLDASQIPAIRNLPSKQAIAIDRLAVKQKLDNAAGAIPFFLSGRA